MVVSGSTYTNQEDEEYKARVDKFLKDIKEVRLVLGFSVFCVDMHPVSELGGEMYGRNPFYLSSSTSFLLP